MKISAALNPQTPANLFLADILQYKTIDHRNFNVAGVTKYNGVTVTSVTFCKGVAKQQLYTVSCRYS